MKKAGIPECGQVRTLQERRGLLGSHHHAGIRPDPRKTEAIREMKEPTSVGELRSFLGMVNQLGKLIPQLVEKNKPLCDLLSKKNCWVWNVDQATAFTTLKKALSSPPVLDMCDPN